MMRVGDRDGERVGGIRASDFRSRKQAGDHRVDRTAGDPSAVADDKGKYRIHAVAEMTGIPAATLRAWERRYGVPEPRRTESSYRVYSDADVELIRHVRELCEQGMAPSEAAKLVMADLERRKVPSANSADPFAHAAAAIVEAVVDALCPWLDRPYALFGHSMGAVTGSEVARRLASLGLRQPAHLVVSARRPAHLRSPDAPLQHLSDAEFVLEIQRRYGGIPPEVMQHADLMALLLPGLRADIAALENFQPPARAPLACPITVLGGQSDALTPPAHLEAWRRETRDDCHVQLLPGDHFYLTPQRDAVLALLRQRLAPHHRGLGESGGIRREDGHRSSLRSASR